MNVINFQNWLSYFNKAYIIKFAGASIIGLLATYCGKIWYSYRFFKRRGIKTPKYRFFWGNNLEITENKNYSEVIQKWTQNYGKTFGYYEGHMPILVTSDVEIIEEIFVKQYGNFSARKKRPLQKNDNDSHQSLFTATKSRWKRMRNIMNPTFSAAKLRQLNPLMMKCTERLVSKLTQNTDTEIDITRFFKRYTMDTIWNCAFGVDTDVQNETNNLYYEKSEEFFGMFSLTNNFNLILFLTTYLYEFNDYWISILMVITAIKFFSVNEKNIHPFLWIQKKIMDVFRMRLKESNTTKRDYVQLLIEARDNNNKSNFGNEDDLSFPDLHLERKITDAEIEVNLVIFLLAGYETTSTALSYAFYILANHPDEQQKLINEIDQHFPPDSDITPDLDSVQKLSYLDLFIKETLRMYPIANSAVNRRCVQKTNIKGIDIPPETIVAVDVLTLHYDKDLWGPEDPKEFHPLRFTQKRHPMAFMAFGQGPRNCIGLKFALFEAKIALVKILKEFEVKSTENTVTNFGLIEGIVRSPKSVKIMLKKRVF